MSIASLYTVTLSDVRYMGRQRGEYVRVEGVGMSRSPQLAWAMARANLSRNLRAVVCAPSVLLLGLVRLGNRVVMQGQVQEDDGGGRWWR